MYEESDDKTWEKCKNLGQRWRSLWHQNTSFATGSVCLSFGNVGRFKIFEWQHYYSEVM